MCDNNYDIGVTKRGGVILSQKVGRPKADNPKDVRYSIRLDVETEKRLSEYCIEHKISKGQAIRNGIDLLLKRKE